MARCPHCNTILDDAWVKRQGASLMGKEGGQAKKRESAKHAIETRWARVREKRKKQQQT